MITCGIATLKDREQSFRVALDRLYPQVDRVYAVLNNYEDMPEWLNLYPRVIAVLGKNSLMDSAKFLFVDICDGYYLSWDDDLVMPQGCVEYLKSKVDEYNCIVTLHGKRFSRSTKNYRKDFLFRVHCLRDCIVDVRVQLGGTGCMMFHTKDFHPSIGDFHKPRMADLWLSKAAAEADVKIMAVRHSGDYLIYLRPENTIWDDNPEGRFQTEVINNFLKK